MPVDQMLSLDNVIFIIFSFTSSRTPLSTLPPSSTALSPLNHRTESPSGPLLSQYPAFFKSKPLTFYSNFRYSPHTEELPPHELSTIIEIDTPATSQLNASINNTRDSALAKLLLQKWPTFREYIREHNLDATAFDPEQSSQGDIDLRQLIDWTTTNPDLMYKLFASQSPIADETCQPLAAAQPTTEVVSTPATNVTKHSTANDSLAFRQFPTHKEYADVGASGLCDSASIDREAIGNDDDDSASLPDMELEAQKRNLIQGRFSDIPAATNQVWQEMSATRTDEMVADSQQNHSSSTDTFEEQLNKMKMTWAGTMLRKTKRLHAMTSSSSSAENFDDKRLPVAATVSGGDHSGQPPISGVATKDSFVDSNITNASVAISMSGSGDGGGSTLSSTSESIDNKKPLNLKEFFARELMRRTHQSSSMTSSLSLLDDDSTLSSNFLRSLLGTSRTTSSSLQLNGADPTALGQTADKHTTTQRTSTPVKVISTDSTSLSIGAAAAAGGASSVPDGNLFSGESRLSSVKDNSANSSSKSSSAAAAAIGDDVRQQQNNNHNFEALAVPATKLQTRDVKSD